MSSTDEVIEIKPASTPTQSEQVYQYMADHTYINRAVAFEKFRIFNLTAVISDMRKHGYKIGTEFPKLRDGKTAKWCRYYLEEE